MTDKKSTKQRSKRKIKSPGVFHDTNGTYYLKYKNKTYRGFKTIPEAEIFKASLRINGDSIIHTKFSIIANKYLQDQESRYKAGEITYGTYSKKERFLRLYIIDELGDLSLGKLSPAVLRDFRNSLIELDKSTVVKNTILVTLKSVLIYAQKYHNLQQDLTIFLDLFPKSELEKRNNKERLSVIWTNSDFELFISDMENEYVMLFSLLFKHGLRLGEAFALRFIDVDYNQQTIDINGSITVAVEKGDYKRKETKTSDSERKIFIGDLVNLIKREQKTKSSKYNFNDSWFICGGSKPFKAYDANKVRLAKIKHHSLPNCTNHEFRHMFVSNAWSAGVPISAISKYIGHSNIAITLSTYSHLTKADDDKLMNYLKNQ